MLNARTLIELLERGDESAVALAAPERESLNFAELRGHVMTTVAALNKLGIGRNDPVAIVLPNGPEMASAFLAIAGGATTAPLNPTYTADEFEFYLSDLHAKVLVLEAGSDSPVLSAASDTSTDGNISLLWADNDIYNPGVSYNVTELTGYSRLTDIADADVGYWQTERFSVSGARAHSGVFSWKANSVNRGYHWLTSVTPVRIQPADSLKFWTWYNIETGWDYFYVQISTDGGFIYENLAHPTLTTNTNPHSQNLGNGITGASGGWIEVAFDLSAFVGQQIHLRLAYYTDFGFLEEGIYLDDINLVDFYASSAPAATGVIPTNVDLTGKAAGDYYYIVQSTDAEGQTGRNSNIVKVTVNLGCCDTPGDADNNQTTNIADVTFLIARIFASGPAPACADQADANGNNTVNIADVTYMIARIFAGGPAPICGTTGS